LPRTYAEPGPRFSDIAVTIRRSLRRQAHQEDADEVVVIRELPARVAPVVALDDESLVLRDCRLYDTSATTRVTDFECWLASAWPVQVQVFDFFSGPRGSAQEFQTRRHARVELKAANVDQLSELLEAVAFDQGGDDHLERDAMQRVVAAGALVVLGIAHLQHKITRALTHLHGIRARSADFSLVESSAASSAAAAGFAAAASRTTAAGMRAAGPAAARAGAAALAAAAR